MQSRKIAINKARKFWSKIAKDNGWYSKPFYVKVWFNIDNTVNDSVSFKGMTGDIIIG